MKEHEYNLRGRLRQATIGRILTLRTKDLYNNVCKMDRGMGGKETKKHYVKKGLSNG